MSSLLLPEEKKEKRKISQVENVLLLYIVLLHLCKMRFATFIGNKWRIVREKPKQTESTYCKYSVLKLKIPIQIRLFFFFLFFHFSLKFHFYFSLSHSPTSYPYFKFV